VNIDAALDEGGHFYRFVHLTAVDSSLIVSWFEDDEVQSIRGGAGHNPEQRDFAAVKHVRQNILERFRVA